MKGCTLAVYRAATSHGARLMTTCIEDAISSQDGGLVIKLGFQDDFVRGQFIDRVITWCEFNGLDVPDFQYFDSVRLGNTISVCNYDENETTSPPGARSRSRSRSSHESLRTDATGIVDTKSELCVYQSVEIADYNQKDSCHLLSNSKFKKTPVDKDPSNMIACSTRFRRAFDGTSARYLPWLRIAVTSINTEPVECEGVGGKVHHRIRVDWSISFMTAEHRRNHGFIWKDGTRNDGENPVERFVYVKDYDVFTNVVDSKYRETTAIWESKVSG